MATAPSNLSISGFKGIHNTVPPERVKSLPSRDDPGVDLVEAVNVDIDQSGQISRRSGMTMKVAGAAHSLWAEGSVCLFVNAGTLYRLGDDFTATALRSGLRNDPMSYVAIGGRIYFSNGTDSGCLDGASRSWGLPIPPSPNLSVVEGSLTGGRYNVILTYLRNDGQESGTALGSQIELAAGTGLRVAWDARPTDAIGVNVYMSEPNGMVMYLVATTAVDSGNVDITSNPGLATPLATQWMDPPPAGQCLAHANGRIYIGAGAFVFATVALGYELCDLRDYLAIDGSRIGFIVGVAGGLFIGTNKAVYFAAGNRLDAMTLRVVVDAPCVPRSGVLADGAEVTGNPEMAGRRVVLFASANGISMGMEDGSVLHLSGRYEFDVGSTSAAAFRNTETLKQYLLFMS